MHRSLFRTTNLADALNILDIFVKDFIDIQFFLRSNKFRVEVFTIISYKLYEWNKARSVFSLSNYTFLKKLYNYRIIWLAVASCQYNLFLIKNWLRTMPAMRHLKLASRTCSTPYLIFEVLIFCLGIEYGRMTLRI